MTAYWLVKSEPDSFSWDQQVANGVEPWTGVRNHTAKNHLKSMKLGDRAFFYHSNEGKEIVGVVEVVKTFYPDPNDKSGKLGMVDVKPLMAAAVKVGLPAMRAKSELAELSLLRQSRLSVCPVSTQEWTVLCGMAGITA